MKATKPNAGENQEDSPATDDGERCENCAALPDGWPCVDCYVAGDKGLPTGGSDE